MSELKEQAQKLEKFKYPLIVLVIGVVLMLIPGRNTYQDASDTGESPLRQVLCCLG